MFGSQTRPGMTGRNSLGATTVNWNAPRRINATPIQFWPSDTGMTNYHHVGADAGGVPLPTASSLGVLITAAAVAAGAYHGYKRTHSAGWAVGWAVLAGLAPIIVIPVALAQGFGKTKSGG